MSLSGASKCHNGVWGPLQEASPLRYEALCRFLHRPLTLFRKSTALQKTLANFTNKPLQHTLHRRFTKPGLGQ
jgi:hypothetical protein